MFIYNLGDIIAVIVAGIILLFVGYMLVIDWWEERKRK